MDDFFEESKQKREQIKEQISLDLEEVSNKKIKDILLQRVASSFFIKGALSNYLHQGLGGKFNEPERLRFASGLEIFASGFVVLDNIVDHHFVRNERTTYLEEYGTEMNVLASHYGIQLGLKKMYPFLTDFVGMFSTYYNIHKIIEGMVQMDMDVPKDLGSLTKAIELTNGESLKIPLIMSATTATKDTSRIEDIGIYGFNLGIAFGIYEEVRDLLGHHGRDRAFELEKGRMPFPLFLVRDTALFNPREYVGRRLSQREYLRLIRTLKDSRAFEDTRKIIQDYIAKANSYLKRAVDEQCLARLLPLSNTITKSADRFIEEIN